MDISNFIFNNQNVTIINENDDIWFKAKEIGEILEYKDSKDAVRRHVDNNDKIKYGDTITYKKSLKQSTTNTINIPPHTMFINKRGIISLIQKSRLLTAKNLVQDLITNFNLNLDAITKTKDKDYDYDYINIIINCFKHLNYKTQYKIDEYKIALYFIDFKIACEEDNNEDINTIYETKRQKYIENQLNCKFVKFNTNDKNFTIHDVINTIGKLIVSYNCLNIKKKINDMLDSFLEDES